MTAEEMRAAITKMLNDHPELTKGRPVMIIYVDDAENYNTVSNVPPVRHREFIMAFLRDTMHPDMEQVVHNDTPPPQVQ